MADRLILAAGIQGALPATLSKALLGADNLG